MSLNDDEYEDQAELMKHDDQGHYVAPYRHGLALLRAIKHLLCEVLKKRSLHITIIIFSRKRLRKVLCCVCIWVTKRKCI